MLLAVFSRRKHMASSTHSVKQLKPQTILRSRQVSTPCRRPSISKCSSLPLLERKALSHSFHYVDRYFQNDAHTIKTFGIDQCRSRNTSTPRYPKMHSPQPQLSTRGFCVISVMANRRSSVNFLLQKNSSQQSRQFQSKFIPQRGIEQVNTYNSVQFQNNFKTHNISRFQLDIQNFFNIPGIRNSCNFQNSFLDNPQTATLFKIRRMYSFETKLKHEDHGLGPKADIKESINEEDLDEEDLDEEDLDEESSNEEGALQESSQAPSEVAQETYLLQRQKKVSSKSRIKARNTLATQYPELMQVNFSIAPLIIHELQRLGFDKHEIIVLYSDRPELFGLNVEQKTKKRVIHSRCDEMLTFLLEKMNFSTDFVKRMISKYPQVIFLDSKKVEETMIELRKKFGEKFLMIVERFPVILTRNAETLKARIETLESEYGIREMDFVNQPGLLATNPGVKLKNRWELFRRIGFQEAEIKKFLAAGCFQLSDTTILTKLFFLINNLKLDLSNVVNNPIYLKSSMEKKLVPRYLVFKELFGPTKKITSFYDFVFAKDARFCAINSIHPHVLKKFQNDKSVGRSISSLCEAKPNRIIDLLNQAYNNSESLAQQLEEEQLALDIAAKRKKLKTKMESSPTSHSDPEESLILK